jgi:hypothetical protein
MPTGINRRTAPRVDARIQVAFQSNEEFIHCYSENISKGGIFLQTDVQPDPNATIEVVLHTPKSSLSDSREIRLKGRVVRLFSIVENAKQVHKVALQFVDLTPQVQTQLDMLYEEFSKP